MRIKILFTTVIVLFALSFSNAQTKYDFSSVDNLLQDAVPKIGGSAVLIVMNNQVLYQKAFGEFTIDEVVMIASASKWLSAGVIMSLVDEGKLSLNDPVSRYITAFTGKKGAITIRQLFSHTSGLSRENELVLMNPLITLETAANRIAQMELAAEPGTEFAYGGISMQVAGRIAEITGGKLWNELFKERIADPLEMKNTDYGGLLGITKNPMIAGGAKSCLKDYGNFLSMIINKGVFKSKHVLSETAIQEMLKNQIGDAVIKFSPYSFFTSERITYGIGVWRAQVDPQTDDVIVASCQGAFGFSPWIDRQKNLYGVLLVRNRLQNVMPVYVELRKMIDIILK